VSAPLRVAVLTVSDRSYRGEREDLGGPAVAAAARRLLAAEVVELRVVPDEKDDIAWNLARLADNVGVDLVLTTGGTGLSERDVTPEATRAVIEREAGGLIEAVRARWRAEVPTVDLGRGLAGTVATPAGQALVVNLPGSVRAVEQYLAVLLPLLPHAVAMLRGGGHPR